MIIVKIKKLYVSNYKLLKDVTIELNPDINIFVGENDAGKSTILEVISIITSGKLHGYAFNKQIKDNMFNMETRAAYIASLSTSPLAAPKIVMEAYFDGGNAPYAGTNNRFSENCGGIRIVVELDHQYEPTYTAMLSAGDIKDIPVEFYRVNANYFSGDPVVYRYCPFKAIFVDTSRKDYTGMVDRFVSENITQYLSEQDQVDLSLAYRRVRSDFRDSETIAKLNRSIKEENRLDGRDISIELREEDLDEWKRQMAISVDTVPFEQIGFGSQNSIKVELAIDNSAENVNLILMEEPENNLSHTNMAKLISKVSNSDGKQIFISTHSSFVANKLSLGNLLLVQKGQVTSFKALPDDTKAYFQKLPGYDTLRVVLAERVILVEGPTDDLIIQRAYFDKYGLLPISKGIDIISVGALAFKRYCDIAIVLGKCLAIVTDNDGDIQENITAKYSGYLDKPFLHFFYEQNTQLRTIEPSVLSVNCGGDGQPTDDFKTAISKNGSMMDKNYDGILSFMSGNKSEWAMRILDSETKISYPQYIEDLLNEYR